MSRSPGSARRVGVRMVSAACMLGGAWGVVAIAREPRDASHAGDPVALLYVLAVAAIALGAIALVRARGTFTWLAIIASIACLLAFAVLVVLFAG